MNTIIERIQKKADVVARRYHDDVDFISVYTIDDPELDGYGNILVDFYEWGGPKMRNGKIVGDHDDTLAVADLEKFVRTLGATLKYQWNGDDTEHHNIHGYWVVFDDTIKG